MQSEEDWTPRPTTQAEEKQATPEVASGKTEAKPKPKPRSRKARPPAKAKPDAPAVEERKAPAVDAPGASDRSGDAPAPPPARASKREASRPAPGEERGGGDSPDRNRREGDERERNEGRKGDSPREANSRDERPRPERPTEEERPQQRQSEERPQQRQSEERPQQRQSEERPQQRQSEDRPQQRQSEERPRHGGGGDLNRHGGGGEQRDRFGNFRNKKKKGKKGRFERGPGGERPSGGGGGGGGGGVPQQQVSHRLVDLPDPSRFQNIEELGREAAEMATGEPLYIDTLHEVSLHDLVEQATAMGIVLDSAPNRRVLVTRMLEKAFEQKRPIIDRGVLEITSHGHGFIARHAHNYKTQPEDPFVAERFISRFGLKKGHQVEAQLRPPEGQERCPSVVRLVKVMGLEPEAVADIVPFEDLVPYYPLQRILLEVPDQENVKDVSMRAVDLLTPIGFGQRGLIVAPPRTGKTVLLQQIANSIATNNPQAHLIVLLVDERPEEVTDFRRHTRGEVVSSTFDEPATSHVEVAEMVIEKARRMVEAGQDVVILLDSITRLARAYNTTMPSSGKILSGGVESNALQKPKRFFGAARNIEEGGSLTILATALIDTGSRMDEVIFEEFKGTGNMELHLDRALVDKRVFPALNIEKSGTRKEELLYHPDEMNRIYSLRRAIQGVPIVEAMEMLVQRLKKTKSNAEFLLAMNR